MKLSRLDKKFMFLNAVIGLFCAIVGIIAKQTGAPQHIVIIFFSLSGICCGLVLVPILTNWMES
jgi:hypothetical protein